MRDVCSSNRYDSRLRGGKFFDRRSKIGQGEEVVINFTVDEDFALKAFELL